MITFHRVSFRIASCKSVVLIDDETIFFIWTGSEKNVSSGQGSDNHEPRSDFSKDFSLFYGSSSGTEIITLCRRREWGHFEVCSSSPRLLPIRVRANNRLLLGTLIRIDERRHQTPCFSTSRRVVLLDLG